MTYYMPMKFFEDTRNLSYGAITEREKQRFWKNDEPDITVTFKLGIEGSNNSHNNDSKKIKVYPYNDPLVALSEFKRDFYDLLLVDIDLPHLNGFELCEKILEIDINVRVCFMTSGEINREALREIYPTLSLGCFLKKPVTIDYLVKRIKAELD